MNILQKALALDEDIRDRLAHIAANTFDTPQQKCRQLQDMQLYLTLLNRHAQADANDSELSRKLSKDEKQQLTSFVEEVRKTLDRFTRTITPEWSTHLDELENLLKEELPKQPQLPQANSLLNTYKGQQLDNRTLAHVLLESMIKGTPAFEGNNQAKMVSFLKNLLEKNQERYGNIPQFPAVLKMLKDAHEMDTSKGFNLGFIQDKDDFHLQFSRAVEKFHIALVQKVQSMKPGDKTLIPIGWTNLKGGHAMEMGIERESNGSLRILIYNLGAGIETYHAQIKENGDTFYQPFLEIIDIDEKKLLDKQFTRSSR